MPRLILFVFLAIGTTLAATGCTPTNEPWDPTGYFESHRTQPPGQHKRLRDRLFHTQGEFERPAHQIN